MNKSDQNPIQRLNPATLFHNPAFSQVISVDASARLVFVGGQNAVNSGGKIVGADIATQTEQSLRNVQAALEAAGASWHDVVKLTIYLVQGQDVREGFAAAQRVLPRDMPPPTISVPIVVALGNPQFLIEVEAVAAVAAGK